ncbi:hypothetical protein [Nostocoides jenkinsii]|uniref:Uncharacterized protein n=1 Tax=Nostocoides jenkinsii Ben 74 TaxID=1193518 RepID=A0A077M9U7_9MICO|nr:hypothetical protein [Tetrasphaera jenkinsii]CCI51587.1 hypothetical protein BN13_1090022 [Tetrasphaera jenkinsii Ben 74]
MPGTTHDDISVRFLESGAIDFDRIGAFVASLGADAHKDDGLHGVLFGRINTLACVLPAEMLERIIRGRDIAPVLEVTTEQ